MKNLNSLMPVPPLFRGSDDEDSEDEQMNKRGQKGQKSQRFQRISRRMIDLSEDEEVDFTNKTEEFGRK